MLIYPYFGKFFKTFDTIMYIYTLYIVFTLVLSYVFDVCGLHLQRSRTFVSVNVTRGPVDHVT